MSTPPGLDEDPHNPASPYDSASEADNEDNTSTLNDVLSLKQGVIKTSNNQTKAPSTILLLGETGGGKSAIVELIANVVIGNDVDHYELDVLDDTNEHGGSNAQCGTKSARLYVLPSKNDVVVRILDTPAFIETGQDEIYRKNIAAQINDLTKTVTAVLIVVNGTLPRITVGTDYVMSMLSTIFTESMISNTALVFTNVMSDLHWNFANDSIPDFLKGVPRFTLNNPVALQKTYLKLKKETSVKKRTPNLRAVVKAGEATALEMLVKLFDWLDGLDPQPTTEIDLDHLYGKPQGTKAMVTPTHAPMGQGVVIKAGNEPKGQADPQY